MTFWDRPNPDDDFGELICSRTDRFVIPCAAGAFKQVPIQQQYVVCLQRFPLPPDSVPRTVRYLRVQFTGKQRQIPQHMHDAVTLFAMCTICKGPVRRPLPRHHVLDRVLAACDSLPAEPYPPIPPTSLIILDRLEDHPKPTAPDTPVGEQRPQLTPQFVIVGPVTAHALLSFEKSLDYVT